MAVPRFWIGASGWLYSHWRGAFYPSGDSPASKGAMIEFSASFYRQPRTTTWKLWRKTAPDGFRFAVKASHFITHVRRLTDPEEPLERVLSGAFLLGDRLGPILHQLPPGFHRTPENLERLEAPAVDCS